MPVTTSQLFDFLDEHQSCSIERHEIASAVFGALRRSVRSMVVSFRESDDQEAGEISDGLRRVLSEWLTGPVPFDDSMLRALNAIGNADAIQMRWGRDIRVVYDDAYVYAQRIRDLENPVRPKLAAIIRDLRSDRRSFRIFCHKQARLHFETLFTPSDEVVLESDAFLHSVTEYRNAQPFGVLIKVGPLRSRGWGSAPDALLTAPRFDTLMQIVWSGCEDEPGFGYDPVSAPPPTDGNSDTPGVEARYSGSLRIGWKVRESRSSDASSVIAGNTPEDADEFQIFTKLSQPPERRPATLVQIDADHGILYPPHSPVLSFAASANAPNSIGYRLPGETLLERMFLVLPVLDDMRLGGLHVEEGHYSRMWKDRLNREFRRDAPGLVERLRAGGLALLHLWPRIDHWRKQSTTVIHAPQQMRYFEILIKVLGLDFDESTPAKARLAPWWQYAWDEIRRARGEAIQTGFHEQQIVDDQLIAILRNLELVIRINATNHESFLVAIPDGQGLRGVFKFYRILGTEEGFVVPQSDLRVVYELNTIDQWRV